MLDDMRFAAKAVTGRHDSFVIPAEELKLEGFHPCRVHGTSWTPFAPTPADVCLIADRLTQRGGKPAPGPVDVECSFSACPWQFSVAAGEIPADMPREVMEQAGDAKGSIIFSAAVKCRKIE
ncbi:hypothetical protein [Streptomyces sp. NPDC060194]|uniref:hypothetical protein n=1 Tax=Streptomyces sp. NPDC060194 TaxID=3347069 RepID=UPI003656A0D3